MDRTDWKAKLRTLFAVGGGEVARQRSPLPAPALPREEADYLVPDNPQLADLRRRYAAHPAALHSIWSPSFVERNLDLQQFRADNAYVWQRRGRVVERTYLRTANYVKRADRLHVFDRLTEDGMFGAQCVQYHGKQVSRDLLDSVLEINAICEFLGSETLSSIRLLDVGAGYGRLALRIVEACPAVKEIICTDAIPESTFLSGFYLNYRGVDEKTAVVPLDQIEATLLSRKATIDLAINVHSFFECPLASIRWWLELIRAAGIARLFIVAGKWGLVSTEADRSRQDFGRILHDCGYRQVFKRRKFRNAPLLHRYGLYPALYYGFELRR